MDLSIVISDIKKSNSDFVRSSKSLSWGSVAECKRLFIAIFCQLDRTMDRFEWLPEYDQVVQWMSNTNGKGLLLYGACGRGKSVITMGVIPVLLRLKNHPSHPIHADRLRDPSPTLWSGAPANPTSLDYLYFTSFPIIDEIGIEPTINNYGEKYDGFQRVINIAEQRVKPVFVSTNLTPEQLLDRYDERTIDRLIRLCKVVEFVGESKRK